MAGQTGGRSSSRRSNVEHRDGSEALLAGSHIGAVGRRRGGALWCHICRDGVERSEGNVAECTACPKRFHSECLQQEGLVGPGQVLDMNTWLCPQCLEEAEDDEIANDDKCFLCRKAEIDDAFGGKMIMCDGCPHSYHMSCLKLTIEPDDEKWFCPDCNPSGFNTDEIRRLGRGAVAPRRGDQANSSTCYVCQRPGKLLGCDFCVNSFHPSCLVDVDWSAIGEEWECPVCRGFDPLANQMHKRWSRQEMEAKRKEREKNYQKFRSKIIKYRNRFLLVHQKDLGPFVNPKILQALARTLRGKRSARLSKHPQPSAVSVHRGVALPNVFAATLGPTSSKRGGRGGCVSRLSLERSLNDILEQLEDEAAEEADKFTRRAYRACRHASGRPIEGLPLREGISLKPHQEEGVDWLLRCFLTGGAILADEMGLGKTIQTLCFLSYLSAMRVEGPHLIVVPLSTVGNWLREIHSFTPNLTHIKICGSRNERQHAMQDRLASKGLYDLYVTTYETVKSEEEFFVETIPHWQCIVLDEAHRIKNASGAIRHSLDRVQGNMRLLLTGTPLQNNAQELFTLINFLMPDVFRDSLVIEQAFAANAKSSQTKAKTAASKGKTKSAAAMADMDVEQMFKEEDLHKIRQLLDRVMLRRLKEQAIALPRKVFHDVWLPVSNLTAQWYRRLLEIKSLQEETRSSSARVNFRKMLGLVIKMRILCAHPKGVCARESQQQRLSAFFSQESETLQEEVAKAARELQAVEGAEHLSCSSKLVFLDKLLCHLHSLNCTYVPDYQRDYLELKRDKATYEFYRRHEETVRQALMDGRKPPRRPKRNELNAISEFRLLFERGLPPGREAVSRSADFLKEGLFPAEAVEPPELKEKLRLQKEARDAAMEGRGGEESSPVSGSVSSAGKSDFQGGEELRQPRRSRRALLEEDEEEDGSVATSSKVQNSSESAATSLKTASSSSAKRQSVKEGSDLSSETRSVSALSTNAAPLDEDVLSSVKASASESGFEGRVKREGRETAEARGKEGSSLEAATASSKEIKEEPAATSGRQETQRNASKTSASDSSPRIQRLLVFTQFQLVLDELEAYCKYRGWKYLRLDGSTNKFVRELDIRDFNSSDTFYFVYLISTRAGGLGINLTAANHVVIFDHDWNPFIDLQAIDRAHRIGQQREVHVWSLVSEWTVEERMAFRREQKLRLDKLLVQQQQMQLLNSADAAADALDEDDEEGGAHRTEKISTDEIRRLMLHGKKAIIRVAQSGVLDVSSLPLEDLISRPRQPLPVSDEEADAASEGGLPASGAADEEELVDLSEVMNEEAEEVRLAQPLVDGTEAVASKTAEDEDAKGGSRSPSPGTSAMDDSALDGTSSSTQRVFSASSEPTETVPAKRLSEAELQNAGVLWRSGRERRKPVAVYVPQEFTAREERRRLRHETRCFVCGNPKDFVQTSVNRDGEQEEVNYGDLVCCSGCPKAYHRCCEGLGTEVKKTWRCRWHECCLCLRKTSQCGNMLIHCARCPTSFCYDCFPPDYCRYNVGEDYYMQLRQRGMMVTPHNWVLLLCSKCKAVEEQQTRRRLTKEEKDREKMLQQELRQQQRQMYQDVARQRGLDKDEIRALQKQRLEEDRRWLENKQTVERQDEAVEAALRQAYQRLFPAAFVAELEKRSAAAKAALRISRQAAAEASSLSLSANSTQGATPTAGVESVEGTGRKTAKKKPSNILANAKLPSQSLALCENCRLPCHGTKEHPGNCPFPEEVQQTWTWRAKPASAGGSATPSTGFSLLGTMTGDSVGGDGEDSQEGGGVGLKALGTSASSPSVALPPSSIQALAHSAALLQEASLGGTGSSSSEAASAFALASLPNDPNMRLVQRQYQERREKTQRLVECLSSKSPIQDTAGASTYESASPHKLKALFQQFQIAADKMLEEAMIEADLGIAVAARASGQSRRGGSFLQSGGPASPPAPPQLLHSSPTLANAGLPSTGALINAIGNDAVAALLNRSNELLLLKRQAELQSMASFSGLNGSVSTLRRGGGNGGDVPNSASASSTATIGSIASTSHLAQGPSASAKTLSVPTPSSENSDVEILKTVPAPSARSSAQIASDPEVVLLENVPSKRGAAVSASANSASFSSSSSSTGKRQRKSAYQETQESSATKQEPGAPAFSQSQEGPASAAAPLPLISKPKSIIDFFASRTKAAALAGRQGTTRKSPRGAWGGLGAAASESDEEEV